jgi:hypothetical protein
MNPDTVSKVLGIEPTKTSEKGKTYPPNSLGRQRIGKLNAWFLSSEGKVDSRDLRRHLDWLLTAIAPKKDKLIHLQGTVGLSMCISCVWWSRSGGGGPTLWPAQMRAMADLNLECTFSFGYYGSDQTVSVREEPLVDRSTG